MENLFWIQKNNSTTTKTDVSINRLKNRKCGSPVSSIRFRNKSYLRVTKNYYIEFAICENKIFFRESNGRNGFKLTDGSCQGSNLGAKITIDLTDFVGDYELLWDEKLKLNYIDTNKKL